MKNYNKEDLLFFLKDSLKLHDEISQSQGLVLFNLKQEEIDVPIDLLLCPHMSAWAIPYLNERLNELNDEQRDILLSVASGNNYWINNDLVPLEIKVEPLEKKVSIDNPILDSFLNLNSEFIDTKISLHRLAKSIHLEPIKNLTELKIVTGKLYSLSKELTESKFNSQYFSGKRDLVKIMMSATEDGGYTISRNDIKQLDVNWVNYFSLEVFGNSDLTVEVLDDKLKNIIKNYEKLKNSTFDSNMKRNLLSEVGMKDNEIIDARNLIYYLKEDIVKLTDSKITSVLDNFLSADNYLLDNCSQLVKDIMYSGLLNISDNEKRIGYLNYVNLLSHERVSDIEAWNSFMQERKMDKLPLYYFWKITNSMASIEEFEDLKDNKVIQLIKFMKSNINWSEFKGIYDIPGTYFTSYEESSILTNVLFKIYDDLEKEKNENCIIIGKILGKYLVKMNIWKRKDHNEDIGVALNNLIYKMKDKGFSIKKELEDNISEKNFWGSNFILDKQNLLNVIENEYSDYHWSSIVKINEKYNQAGLNSLHESDDLIPWRILNVFLKDHLHNDGIKKFCEKYLLKNCHRLPLTIINDVKDGVFPLLDKNLLKDFNIDIFQKYKEAYDESHFLLANKSNGFKINLVQAKEILSNINQYKEEDRFNHILFIGKSLENFNLNENEIYEFLIQIENHVNFPVREFNDLLYTLIFDNLSGKNYVKSLENHKENYIKMYSQEDYYAFISELINRRKNTNLSYDDKNDIKVFQNDLSINCEKIINKLSISEINDFLENENFANKLDANLIKKVANRTNEIKSLNFSNYENIFKKVLSKKIDNIKNSYTGRDDVHLISNDINNLFVNYLENLKDNPAAYVLMWSSSKNALMESWKYSADDETHNNKMTSNEYVHKLFCEHVDIDIFNQGVLDLKNNLSHLDRYNQNYAELGNNQREYLEFEVFFRKIYSLTWASCKKIDDYFEYENKSLLSFDKKDKIWDYIESNFPEFLINMDACNVSDRGFNDVQFKDWNKIFTLLSQNSASDSNYRIIDLKNTDSMLNCFLNYDAESNVESLNYLQHIIFVALNSKNVVYQNNSDDEKNEIEEISSAIRDWYDVRNVKSSMLVKNIINNDMRIKEIQALSELVYLNNNVKSNDIKSNVFKV